MAFRSRSLDTQFNLVPASPGDSTKFLDGSAIPAFDNVRDSDLSTSDITTNDVTSSKHGFTPKSPADTAKFLMGDTTPSWSVGFPLICQGRLTLTSGTSVTTADVTGATNVFFTPHEGNRVALYTSSLWKLYTFTEVTLALGTLTSGLPYDVFLFDNSGTLTLEAVAWTSGTARVTGLVSQDGVLVKSGSTNKRYLGTFYTTSTTATEDSYAKRFLWNYYHRKPRPMRVSIGTDSYNYTTDAFREAEGGTANRLQFVLGVAEEEFNAHAIHISANSTGGIAVSMAIGEDSTTVAKVGSIWGYHEGAAGIRVMMSAHLKTLPAIGFHFYSLLERSAATGTTTWYGDNGGTRMQAGIIGTVNG